MVDIKWRRTVGDEKVETWKWGVAEYDLIQSGPENGSDKYNGWKEGQSRIKTFIEEK